MSLSPLVILHKQLGDVLLLEPALHKLANAVQGKVMLATRPEFAPMIELMRDVVPMPAGQFRRASEVVSFGPRLRAGLIALTTAARKKQLVVFREDQLRAWHQLIYRQGTSVVKLAGRYRGWYYYHAMPVPEVVPFRLPQLMTPPAAWRSELLPDNYVLLHLTSAWPIKSWPVDSWAQVLDQLGNAGVGPFVVTGGQAEWERAYVAELEAKTKTPLINLCGKTNLKGYLSAVASARALLCIDGSSAHLASAFGVPALTLFGGASDPGQWHCPTALAHRLDARNFSASKGAPIADIPVSAVVEQAVLIASLDKALLQSGDSPAD
jgi:ADP-heptose:LPS heptosyltransferase